MPFPGVQPRGCLGSPGFVCASVYECVCVGWAQVAWDARAAVSRACFSALQG